jgi:hypothetical protein
MTAPRDSFRVRPPQGGPERSPLRARLRAGVCVSVIAALTGLGVWLPLHAQSGGIYKISRSTIDAGGGLSTGGVYSVHGTIGQHDAAVPMTGGSFVLQPGFWTPSNVDLTGQLPALVFRNGFEG